MPGCSGLYISLYIILRSNCEHARLWRLVYQFVYYTEVKLWVCQAVAACISVCILHWGQTVSMPGCDYLYISLYIILRSNCEHARLWRLVYQFVYYTEVKLWACQPVAACISVCILYWGQTVSMPGCGSLYISLYIILRSSCEHARQWRLVYQCVYYTEVKLWACQAGAACISVCILYWGQNVSMSGCGGLYISLYIILRSNCEHARLWLFVYQFVYYTEVKLWVCQAVAACKSVCILYWGQTVSMPGCSGLYISLYVILRSNCQHARL